MPESLVEPVQVGYTLLIVYVAAAIGFSFVCSVAEAVLLSITPAFIEGLRSDSPARAEMLHKLRELNLDRSLAAILTLNTIAHTAGATAAGAEATRVLGSAWFGIFSAILTLGILVLSEIVPKTLGATYWRILAIPVAYLLKFMIISLWPLVWASERLTKLMSNHGVESFSRDEVVALVRVGERTGSIGPQEARIVENLFAFSTLRVTDIMTPRTVVGALPEETTIESAVSYVAEHPFSRIPLYRDNLDTLTGFVLRFDILLAYSQGRTTDTLASLARSLTAVPSSQPLSSLMTHLVKENNHMAAVVNEYGGTDGVVTVEDLMETLTGFEIVDEMDKTEDMQQHARKLWRSRAKGMGIPVSDRPYTS